MNLLSPACSLLFFPCMVGTETLFYLSLLDTKTLWAAELIYILVATTLFYMKTARKKMLEKLAENSICLVGKWCPPNRGTRGIFIEISPSDFISRLFPHIFPPIWATKWSSKACSITLKINPIKASLNLLPSNGHAPWSVEALNIYLDGILIE